MVDAIKCTNQKVFNHNMSSPHRSQKSRGKFNPKTVSHLDSLFARTKNLNHVISVIGLGYVGLPLAVAFAKHFQTIGYDINRERLNQLKQGVDYNSEIKKKFLLSKRLSFTDHESDLSKANFHVIAVPTPIDADNKPDITALLAATKTVAGILKRGDIVVYESTVYPGLTEEKCLPLLEKVSGLKSKIDFKLGYSPERMNPGDKAHTLEKIIKIVSGQDEPALDVVAAVYKKVAVSGVHRASSIRVAEAAKVIENVQRDLNIALMNELSMIFDRMGLDTREVLEAAATKWNFAKFTPGLVGGHCIGVDSYYLTHKAIELGHHPRVILAGRDINNSMAEYVAEKIIAELRAQHQDLEKSLVTVLGVTFKENCSDTRNSQVFRLIDILRASGVAVQIHDPLALQSAVSSYGDFSLLQFKKIKKAQAVVVAVAHDFYRRLTLSQWQSLVHKKAIIADLKSIMPKNKLNKLSCSVWRL